MVSTGISWLSPVHKELCYIKEMKHWRRADIVTATVEFKFGEWNEQQITHTEKRYKITIANTLVKEKFMMLESTL